jgi:hypothetical protein
MRRTFSQRPGAKKNKAQSRAMKSQQVSFGLKMLTLLRNRGVNK